MRGGRGPGVRMVSLVVALAATALAGEPDDPLAAARDDLRRSFSPPVAEPLPDVEADAQQAREEAELARIRPVPVQVTVRLPGGRPLGGTRVRAWHPALDLATPPIDTGDHGGATLRLPPGEWLIGLALQVDGDTVAFGRVSRSITGAGEEEILLAEESLLRFRGPNGSAAAPDAYVLATDDLVHDETFTTSSYRTRVLRPAGCALVVQAVRKPGSSPGYLLRVPFVPGANDLGPGMSGATKLVFRGRGRHLLAPNLDTVDGPSSELEFQTTRTATVHVIGLQEVAVGYGVRSGSSIYEFYPSPIPLDGSDRTFGGGWPFEVSVGYRWNTESRFRSARYGISFRVFLKDECGLIMRGSSRRSPFPVTWTARLGEKVIGEGEMRKAWRARLGPVEKDDLPRLRFDLTVHGPSRDRRDGVVPGAATEVAREGVLRVRALPDLAPNARAWARWAGDLLGAFQDSTMIRPRVVTVHGWVDAMPRLSGWGGWKGNASYALFADSRLFGFVRPRAANDGTVSHELTHAFHRYAHDRTFQRLQLRAVRRMRSLRRDAHRTPSGDAVTAVLAALATEPAGGPRTPPPGLAGGHRRCEDGAIGEDPFVLWYLRVTTDGAAPRLWSSGGTWSWWLTTRGFTDDEVKAGMLSHLTGRNLAWLVRLRGGDVSDRRAGTAWQELVKPSAPIPSSDARKAAAGKWAAAVFSDATDLDAALSQVRDEVGSRAERAAVLLRLAEAAASRDLREQTHAFLQSALTEAWQLGDETFEKITDDAARVWAQIR